MTSTSRLMREYQDLMRSNAKDPDVYCAPSDDSGLRSWRAWLKGPEGSPYDGYFFEVEFSIPPEYPLVPPVALFRTRIFHPNIHWKTGEICLDILKSPHWSPAWGISSVCRALLALMTSPEADSPLNCDAGNLIRNHDLRGFRSMGRMFSQMYATRSRPSPNGT
eukprot:ANDGO_00511.mRNA.1 Protein PEROXIN-4